MPRQPSLFILTANDLLEGDVLFLAEDGWTRDHRAARIAASAEEAKALEAVGARDKAAMKIVDPYLVEVSLDGDGAPVPVRHRERIRTLGPTVRPDLGRQAALRANTML